MLSVKQHIIKGLKSPVPKRNNLFPACYWNYIYSVAWYKKLHLFLHSMVYRAEKVNTEAAHTFRWPYCSIMPFYNSSHHISPAKVSLYFTNTELSMENEQIFVFLHDHTEKLGKFCDAYKPAIPSQKLFDRWRIKQWREVGLKHIKRDRKVAKTERLVICLRDASSTLCDFSRYLTFSWRCSLLDQLSLYISLETSHHPTYWNIFPCL